MDLDLVAPLLAQLPNSTVYISLWKLPLTAALIALWALFAQWTDKDAVAVNTYRVAWNLATLLGGAAAIAALFFVPVFWGGLAAFLVIFLTIVISYVMHRNGLVEEDFKVGTVAHLKRLMTRDQTGKKKLADVRERVRLVDAFRKPVRIPDDEIEREQFRIAQDLFFDGLWRRAGVIDMQPSGQATEVTYLIDGVPTKRDPLPRQEGDAVTLYIKRLAGLNVEERRKPQMGKLQASIGENKMDLSVRTSGSAAGEQLQVRVLGPERFFKVKDIGMTEAQLGVFQELMHADMGLTVVSAPRGNGLTTTVYSIARSHDAFLQNIQTVEYMREMELENITQRIFEPGDDRTFAGDLQKVVRADPDVVLLPDLRDKQAAVIAAEAAAHKQRVYVGIRANDLWDSLRLWVAAVGDPRLAAKGLRALIHQRLVRVLCAACKTPYKPDAGTLRKLNLPADKLLYRPPEPQYDKHGNPILCQACQGTGYVGRTGVFQIVLADDRLRQLIADGAPPAELHAHAVTQGVPGLQQLALQKVFEGITSIDEVVRATRVAQPAKASSAAH